MELSSGILHLDAEITYENTVIFLATLRQMEVHSGIKEITIHITCHGGALMPSVAIVQALKVCRKPVATLGSGYVASAALPILAAGSAGKRTVLEGTLLLLHQPTHTMGETSRKSPAIGGWKHEIDFHEEVTRRYYWCLEQCSLKSAQVWQDLLGSQPSRIVGVDEAIDYGLIDAVKPLRSQAVTSAPV